MWLAEFIGTFALVFVGVGAIAAGLEALAVALAFACAVAVMIAAVGPISAAHFNPAVTLAFWAMRRTRLAEVPLYWSAQLAAGVVAVSALSLWGGADRLEGVAYGATRLAPGLSPWAGVGVEAVLTFFLVFVIASIVIRKHAMDGLYIGLTVGAGALAGGSLTGASMNPARSFGPALVSGEWGAHWVYWVGPCLGAVAAALSAQYLWTRRTDPLAEVGRATSRGHPLERGEQV
ncbi:MIP/aquaporin family protein [Truepera radiovictrix]|uniref:MIP/aquaporin family protein n=1 Tax=Truepera radiovictrix TaxID=332249 RepID=UPI001C86C9C2|nr:aquaporin [Truepera radiovictrix]